jgi:hypothetical protein
LDKLDKILRIAMQWVIGLVSLILMVMVASHMSYGQQRGDETILTYLPFRTVSAEITRFKEPIRLVVGKRKIEYEEALILILDVSQKNYEALPPSIEPYLYIGDREYRIFSVQRSQNEGMLTLTFHIRDWQAIPDMAPMAITILHGEPISNPGIFIKFKSPGFNKAIIKEKRE